MSATISLSGGPSGASPPPAAPAYRVLARKYRPADFSALIGQEPMVRTLSNAFAANRIAQAWMLTGVRGVGKTTTARILARALNFRLGEKNAPSIDLSTPGDHCEAILAGRHVDVVEMDAASHTGIDDIREIIEQVRYAPVSARYKVYIIDEVHMLSTQAFNGLLKTLEEPPPHVKFIFATTEIRKVPITVLSRCQRFDLRRVESGLLVSHLSAIAQSEGVSAEPDALAAIARASEGSVRDALSILDQAIAHGAGAVTADAVRVMLGLADRARVLDLFGSLMSGDVASALAEFRAQYEAGADPVSVLTDLAEFTHLVTRVRFVADGADASLSPTEQARAAEFAQALSLSVLSRAWQMLLKGITETQGAPRPASAAEMVLIRLAHAAHLPTLDEALASLKDGVALSSPKAVVGATAATGAGGAAGFGVKAGANGAPNPSAPRPTSLHTYANGPTASAADAPRAFHPAGFAPNPTTAATAVQLAPQPEVSRAPDPAPEAVADDAVPVRGLADVVKLAELNRDMAFKILVKQSVRPVRVEPGRLEVSFTDSAPATLATDLSNRLSKWTGRKWFVTVSRQPGGKTLAELETEAREDRLSDARADPTVAAILDRFAGSRVIDVRLADEAPDEMIENPPAPPSSDEPDEDHA